jgi:hypothetical protein
MSTIKEKVINAVTSHKGQKSQIETAVQGITTNIGTLEAQFQEMLAQSPVNPTAVHNAANTVQVLKTQAQALVSALESGSPKAVAPVVS